MDGDSDVNVSGLRDEPHKVANEETDTTAFNDDAPSGATCRICRGEATDDNPLFHPCKCRGSIKYMHESCLLEWVASKNIDISKPGADVKCDICHYPIQFKTIYAENMPEKIPFSLLLSKSVFAFFEKTRLAVTIGLAAVLYVIGVPLVWNMFGKVYTMMLDGSLPYPGDLTKSLIYGYDRSKIPELTTKAILYQLLQNHSFTSLQFIMIVILHIALYFQYDMIVREDVFSKMVFHKIGPRFSPKDLKSRLKERFPMMDDRMVEYLAREMRAHDENRQDQGHDRLNMPAGDVADNNDVNNPEGENRPPQDPREHRYFENLRHVDELDHDEVPEEQYNDDSNDNLPLEEDSSRVVPESPSDHEGEEGEEGDQEDQENQGEQQQPQPEEEIDYRDHIDPNPMDMWANHRAQNEFDDIIAAQQNAINRPNAPVFIPPPAQNRVGNVDQDEQDFGAAVGVPPAQANGDDQGQGPLVINLKLKLLNVIAYFIIAVVFTALYLAISYLVPTFIGFGLLKVYFGIFRITLRGLSNLYYLSGTNIAYNGLTKLIPKVDITMNWISNHVIQNIVHLYYGYTRNNMKHSIFIRAIPALTTYLTSISIVSASSNLVSRGYGRENGMSNSTRRLIFQILFALKCTFKVFTLFFIELAGFPILAGVMLDFSLFCPILASNNQMVWVPSICTIWPPFSLFVYWTIGTLYMYWFAKYIGMIRKNIIRPGVLFFIRSPEDPNIKILHDSLIHPMGIQLSRLCLSMFIYAIFIVLGFGFHTRFLFPFVIKSTLLSVPEAYKPTSIVSWKFATILLTLYFTKRILESSSYVKPLLERYWKTIFRLCSRKLRLSSFILGKDTPTERGHIVYRNLFYKYAAAKNAEWSNPELFTKPKTLEQAEELLGQIRDVHAYFVPDGVLMRVPSSDIVSRNYVQTMFVPVTKNDKLLKPLDLERIKERNKRAAGEFGYLDEQNTEYDQYYIVYVPPDFRLRYMTLLGLVWLFASILMLGVTFASQALIDFGCVFGLLPALKFLLGENNKVYVAWKELSDISYSHLNIYYVCIGSVCLSKIAKDILHFTEGQNTLDEHTVHDNEVEEVEHNIPERDINNVPVNNVNNADEGQGIFMTIINSIFDSILVKYYMMVFIAITIVFIRTMVSWIVLTDGILACYNYITIRISGNSSYTLGNSKWFKYDENLLFVIGFISSMVNFGVGFKSLKLFFRNRNANKLKFLNTMTLELFKQGILHLAIYVFPIIILSLIFLRDIPTKQIVDIRHGSRSFALSLNGSFPTWTRMQHIYFGLLISLESFTFFFQATILFIKWFKNTVQNVKDEVYTKGRALENLPDEN
ncbi:ssm4p [Saccharomyces arboricola H-6]|uniref:RING-type E3 ubiquitin transferase n=1 Tax=Saccharomyces arboricola (strain H-6 / AS 2.3317 / CBS 10644) TaxID=1160507 RepID=J8Q6T5_SACAR|nr:ssm4p [Saccharomyces arboricola H-6]